ncbi:hypothetical protein [Oleiagrimonas sp. MCCC 1A03011]|uniref:hypothetical protein n=1 Tax=Oleiagrimonas sp. MCCC 1A03011 TaxID=1926883 RepID=UPI000DC604A8|nr:hypothetical protein [Oleiagrimonas sp. MCCC 1A03011]RAP58372.1 hypothetical protein BTJ49_05335 [Oleiagrimonas sp. MCCC 1A03011]
MKRLLSFLYTVGTIATFVYLMFFDKHGLYQGWNWFIKIPLNVFLASIWPLYWIAAYFLHWIPWFH